MSTITLPGRPRAAADPGTTVPQAVPVWARWPVLVAAAALGIVIVGWSYRLSAQGASSAVYYLVFWAGLLLGALPAAGAMIGRSSSPARRVWALALLAVLTAVPKYLRNPDGPLYHDEYAHWRQAVDVLSSGHLGEPNAIIPIVQYYPGTSALTAGLQQLTGLSVWQAGELVVLATHVLSLFAALVLIGTILGSVRAGAVGALVYALNSSVLYFDTQYAYESVAIAFYLWVLALAALAAREPDRVRRGLYVAGSLLVAGACVVTHHLTTLALIGTLLLISGTVLVAQILRRRSARRTRLTGRSASAVPSMPMPVPAARHMRTWWTVTAGAIAMAAAWLLLAAWPTVRYLSPYAGTSVQQLGQIAGQGDGGRELLAASVQPLWERGLSALAPVLVGVACLIGGWLLWRERRRWPADAQALALFGLVYFPSVLFILAPMGAEGARRSWAFTYIGVALIVAVVFQRKAGSWRRRLGERARAALVLVLVAVVMIGNVGAGLNDPSRFPGPFRWGTDTNSASAEARVIAELLGGQAGAVRAVSDRYTGLALSAYGGVWVATPSAGFPAAELAQTDRDPTPELAAMLYTSHIDYLVVDLRMAQEPAYNGDNFGNSDPLPGRATPVQYLERLDDVPWASRVLTTEHLRVYRLDMTALSTNTEGSR